MFLSLCMPTNGIEEWVFPALDSIYSQGVSEEFFEVIVTDNGENECFYLSMKEYEKKHANLIYKKTDAYMFENQLETLKIARGDYLKFVNHRSIWVDNGLRYMIDFLSYYEREKPVIYFANGSMNWGPEYREFNSFNEFVYALGIQATWTSGVGIWKEDYDKLPFDLKYDSISPHACILYAEREKKKYVIDDKYWMHNITSDHSKKGKYDLYKAFSLDEFIISIQLYHDGSITVDTLKHIKEEYRKFLIDSYYDFNLKKKPCSYILTGFDEYVDVFFDKNDIINCAKKRLQMELDNKE